MTALLTFLLGIVIGRAATLNGIRHRQSVRRDLAAELRRPVDLERCEFSEFWQEPSR